MSEHTYDERLDNDLSSSCHYQLDQQKIIHMYDILIYILVCLYFGFSIVYISHISIFIKDIRIVSQSELLIYGKVHL